MEGKQQSFAAWNENRLEKMSEDRILNGMSQRDIYKKQSQGGYDVPDKKSK